MYIFYSPPYSIADYGIQRSYTICQSARNVNSAQLQQTRIDQTTKPDSTFNVFYYATPFLNTITLLYGLYKRLRTYNRTMKKILFYTPDCMPCHNDEYHYYDTVNLIKSYGFVLDERLVKAVPQWQQEAEAFNAPLPLVYEPESNQYLSIYPFNKEHLDAFLRAVK